MRRRGVWHPLNPSQRLLRPARSSYIPVFLLGARWRDVIHPEAVEQIGQSQHLLEAGWANLLDAKRLMGPSLHAFVSRALANFSHRIVPWVVEMEFSGRLIYVGGDEVLCLAPADEALDLAARLQQLFSAAWIIDTDYQTDPWCWRRTDWKGDYNQECARQRFAIPKMPTGGSSDRPAICLPVTDPALLERHTATAESGLLQTPVQGPLLPMLGPYASLSAGIAFAHYKIPMSVLLRKVKSLLDWAKEPFKDRDPEELLDKGWQGRRAVALSHASRGGFKTEFVLPWSELGKPPEAHRTLNEVRKAFADGDLSSRLPYKLRELAPSTYSALRRIRDQALSEADRQKAEERLLRGLFRHCLEKPKSAADAAFKLWRVGINLHWDQPDDYTDGLLLCRALARSDSEEGGEAE